MSRFFSGIYQNKRVVVTGHTGFKGSWLAYWLKQLGAVVCGYSLSLPTTPNHFDELNLSMVSELGDIRDRERLQSVFQKFQPEIVFHLAAQALVRHSYEEPVETFETNLMGTVNILEACRQTLSVRAIVNVTSDKCYENREWVWGYRESDPMGGYDPYSASKGCAELIGNAYRNSFFHPKEYGKKHRVLVASCRAGNVIGGGDWARDRLIPDIVIATSQNKVVPIRNPQATRPWQHVLEPLSGYLQVGQKLLEGKVNFAQGWNFGPGDEPIVSVGELVEKIKDLWPKIQFEVTAPPSLHEATLLKLDCSKAHHRLSWRSVWDTQKTFEKTIQWYRQFYEEQKILTDSDLQSYLHDAKAQKILWTQ